MLKKECSTKEKWKKMKSTESQPARETESDGSQLALVVKNLPANAGDTGDMSLITGLGRSPEGGNGNPLQYSCLENPMDRGAGGLQSVGLQRVEYE